MKDYIDITYPLSEEMAIYPLNPIFSMKSYMAIEKGDTCNVKMITMGTHTGTHIDAPNHVMAFGKTLDQIPLDRINGRAKVLDFTGKKEITIQELAHKQLDNCPIILFKTDNSIQYGGRNILTDYVTLDYDAARYLVQIGVNMIGIDYMTIERPRTRRDGKHSIHEILLSQDIYILEGIDLSSVNEGEYEIYCFPLHLLNADGAPARVALASI